MASDNANQLSMNEILASIRGILRESIDLQPTDRKEETAADVSELPQHDDNNVNNELEQDIATVCKNIRKITEPAQNEFFNSAAAEKIEPQIEVPEMISKASDPYLAEEYDNLTQQFSKLFQNRRANAPLADETVRDLAENAVVNEVVPILQQWLNDYLPDLIAKEIERVTVKAGKY